MTISILKSITIIVSLIITRSEKHSDSIATKNIKRNKRNSASKTKKIFTTSIRTNYKTDKSIKNLTKY